MWQISLDDCQPDNHLEILTTYDENIVKCLKIQIVLYTPNKLVSFECIKTICARIRASRDPHVKPKKVCWSENDIRGPCICFENGRKCLCIVKTALLEVKDVLEFTMHTCMHDLHQTPQKHYNGFVNLLVLVFIIYISSNMMSSGQGKLLMKKKSLLLISQWISSHYNMPQFLRFTRYCWKEQCNGEQ